MEIQANYLADAFLALMIFIGAAAAAVLIILHEMTRNGPGGGMTRLAVVSILVFVLSGVAASGLHRLTAIQEGLTRTCDPPTCTRISLVEGGQW